MTEDCIYCSLYKREYENMRRARNINMILKANQEAREANDKVKVLTLEIEQLNKVIRELEMKKLNEMEHPILIGSSAIKHWFPSFPREPKDKDYLMYEYQGFNILSTRETEYMHNKIITDLYCGTGKRILEANDLTTLKASHLCWKINWDKHMFDLQFLLKQGCKINTELFWKLYSFWDKYHGANKRSDITLNKADFFNNAINYNDSEHDDIHKILNPIPVYTLVLKDGADVELDENKFIALTHEQKLNFVREEVMVMAWERYRELDYRIAYSRMLKKFIMGHCPLFALLFVIENYVPLLKIPNNYIKQINHGINQHQGTQ